MLACPLGDCRDNQRIHSLVRAGQLAQLDRTSFALDAPAGGDFIEPNVALDAVLRTACEMATADFYNLLLSPQAGQMPRREVYTVANFHLTMKIIGRSKGKSVIATSAYLNGAVMKNDETGKYSYYTSKKEVVYRQLMMCKNAPPEWEEVPKESIERFKASVRYKSADNKEEALEQFKIIWRKQKLWNEVLKIENKSDLQLGRSLEFSLPKEWSREEQTEYTTEYIRKNFVDKGMCADWAIHDKGDGNPHVHLILTVRPFQEDHTWGNKEAKDWEFVRDASGSIVIDPSHPDWWQDKKNPERCGIRIPVLDKNGNQKLDSRNRKQWKRVLTDATGWNDPKNCELWRSEWAKLCNEHLPQEQQELLSEMYGDLVNLDQQLQKLEGECQNWYELASKLSAENKELLRQNEELLKLSKR